MHFSTITATLLVGTAAAQIGIERRVFAAFYNSTSDTGCNFPGHEPFDKIDIIDQGVSPCINLTINKPITATKFTENTLQHTLCVYAQVNCDTSGRFLSLRPGEPDTCKAQAFKSYKLIDGSDCSKK